jgi:hypothetical protein
MKPPPKYISSRIMNKTIAVTMIPRPIMISYLHPLYLYDANISLAAPLANAS